uniref:Uncharacterized protein n=1 Tax=Anopheles stephensi TaxID=30069 RepID=A0A182YM09_ANOST
MAKRGPQSSLNHLNWNETDEPEEKGEFAKASDDVLKQRVIKKARRRVATDAADSTAPGAAASAASTSVFGSFKGFASTPLAKGGADKPDGAPTFSFLSTLGAAAGAKTNGNGTATVSSSGADSGVAGSAKPMFSFGTNQGTIGDADASKKMFTFGTPNALKADSTEGAKNASSTSAGFGISSSKDGDKEGAGKGLFSFGGPTAANPTSGGPTPTFSFGTVPPKPTDASKPDKNFTFGFAGGNKDKGADTTPKATFSFGSIAAKQDAGEAEKKPIAFGSPIGSKDSSLSAASSTGMFNFGSNAAKKSDTNDAEKKTFGIGSSPAAPKSTFAFGSPATKTDSAETERKGFTFGSSPAASKEPAAATKGIFAFGSPAAKSAPADTPGKATVTFGSPAGGKDTATTTPKGTFSFGSVTPKANADEGSDKKATFSFGSVASSGTQSSPKTTFSFGSLQPNKSDAVGFGAPSSPSKKPSEPEKKTFSFGIPPAASVTADKSKATFGPPKENSEDTIKKMFSFAPSATTAPKAADSGKKEEEKKSVSFPLATTTTKPVSVPSAATHPGAQSANMKANVIALNHAFVAWITQKCKENAYCNFSPVFKSYEKYFAKFKEMEQNGTEKSLTNSSSSSSSSTEATSKLTSTSSASQPTKVDFPTGPAAKPVEPKPIEPVTKEPEKAKEKTGFFFGTSAPKESLAAKTLATPAPPAAAGGFTFGSGKPLTFGGFSSTAAASTATTNSSSSTVSTTSPSFFAGASTFASKAITPGGFTFGSGVVKPPVPDSSAAANKDAAEEGDADEDEPPKVEFTPVVEKDSLYSKRCKMYFKVDGSFSDRGVGTLHVKKVESKVQLLVRADTSLGNIMLNIILNESVPLQRVGKNNVMLICLPTPDAKPPPKSVLLRVKTGEEADELMATLLKFKPK